VVIDAGAGDGRWVLQRARAEPARFFIGFDSNPENLAESSHRASRKPQRGGTPNALYVHAAAENPPAELESLADELAVLLPWSSLLAAVAIPDPAALTALARLCKPGAELRVVFGYDASLEAAAVVRLPLLTDEHLRLLPASYAKAGFRVTARRISNRDLLALGTTWSARLAHRRLRHFCEIRGRYHPGRRGPVAASDSTVL
jgi:16S rRNA (adenine(1408)-N(1))-methyltransferase